MEDTSTSDTSTSNKLYITFTIDTPETIEQSNFNTLVLSLQGLNHYIKEETLKTTENIKWNNYRVEEMQRLLECFKYKEI